MCFFTGVMAPSKIALASFAPQALPSRAIYTDDNLPILRGINSETVDLIYLDPPFNTGRGFPFPGGGKKRKMAFTDTWKWSDEHDHHRYMLGMECPEAVAVVDTARLINSDSHGAYIVYMGVRLLEMRRILKPAGSVYFHCDSAMSHSVKMLMDAVFGIKNFRNELIWFYPHMSAAKRHFPKKHDNLFFYTRGDSYTFNGDAVREQYDDLTIRRYKSDVVFPGGYRAKMNPKGRLPYSVWKIPLVRNVSKEKTGYPTQKPMALLERIVRVSSNKGDLVLDPFCGCATTCVAAERNKRRWIGVDISPEAKVWVEKRMQEDPDVRLAVHRDVEYPQRRPVRTDLPRTRINRAELLPVIHANQSGICNGCRRAMAMDLMDIDHIQSRARGGSDDLRNLQLLCRTCNTMKGAGTMEELITKLKEQEAAEQIRLWREGINEKIAEKRRP